MNHLLISGYAITPDSAAPLFKGNMKHNFLKLNSPQARNLRAKFLFDSIEVIARMNKYDIKKTEQDCKDLISELYQLTEYQRSLHELPWQN